MVDAGEPCHVLGLAADSHCDLGQVSSPLCASTIPSVQWEQDGAELWNLPGASQPGPTECRPPDLPRRTPGLLHSWQVAHCFPSVLVGRGVHFGDLAGWRKS